MTNEMKLLRAFIEASGFDIEEVDTNKATLIEAARGIPAYIEISYDYKVTKKIVFTGYYLDEGKL